MYLYVSSQLILYFNNILLTAPTSVSRLHMQPPNKQTTSTCYNYYNYNAFYRLYIIINSDHVNILMY